MVLSLDEIRKAIRSPKNSQAIKRAVRHENHLRFHAEPFMDFADASQTVTEFLNWVKTLIPKDKYKIFVSLFRLPAPTVQLTEQIFKDLARVFEGKNPSFSYQFTDSTFRDDWGWYRSNVLKEGDFFKTKGLAAMKTAINSVLIVDLPEAQDGVYPSPYFYLLGIESVIDYEYKDGKIEWIIFKQADNKIACFDAVFYRTLKINDKGEITGEVIEKPHNLGYCPAKFFWSDPLIQKQPDLKKSPLSPQLSNLDWLLFFLISKRHLDLYAPYPIYSAYAADCDFRNNETGDYCDGGFLRDQNQHYKVLRDGSIEQCPVCASKKLAGVGSFIEIPIPTGGDPDLRNPVQITTVDKNSLDYNVEEVARLKKEIFESVVGTGGGVNEKQSINEMQVTSSFESKLDVLNAIKRNLEEAIKFVDDTCCTLRYGENFVGSSISLGTEFYIHSAADLYEQYKKAKENGASEATLDLLQDQIMDSEYRNNEQAKQRAFILKHLEPYRHFTFEEIIRLQEESLLNPDALRIKVNFASFIDRFERENINIIEFGAQLDFDAKIRIISNKLLEYVKEQYPPLQDAGIASGKQCGYGK